MSAKMSAARSTTAKKLQGTRLGGYTVVEHLATGGMAEIFLASHEAAGAFRKELVLKVLQPRWAEHEAVVEMFLGEARIAAMLTHPNIVDIYDVACEEGLHFIAMEYIRGKTLTEVARRAIEMSQDSFLHVGVHIVAEVAAALAYMNEGLGADGQPMRVVHRDVSPTNVIIGTSGQVKLIDFGIARQGTAIKEESGVRPGKASYMSPEQAQAEALDGRSDIFSLGTILYEITVGRRLWRGSKESAIRRIVEEKPAPPSFVRRDYPSDLEMVVMRALEKKPDDRYQSAREFADDLQHFLQDAGAKMRSHHQLGRYLHDLYSPEAETRITEDGLQQGRLFAEGDEEGRPDEIDALDFDQPKADGPGAALARAMRAGGSTLKADGHVPDDSDDQLPVAKTAPSQDSAAPADDHEEQPTASPAASPAGLRSAATAPAAVSTVPSQRQTPLMERVARAKKAVVKQERVPVSPPIGAILLVVALLAAAAVGLVWLLR